MPVSKDLTELVDIDPTRVDLVKNPANGFPILLMKAVGGAGCGDNCGPGCTSSYHDGHRDGWGTGYDRAMAEKAVNAQGGIDEKPDISGAEHVMVLLAKLIQAEAAELATGQWGEVYDIELLIQATHLIGQFRACEQMGDVDDGESVYKDTLLSKAEIEQAATRLAKRKFSSDERKRLAEAGHALPDGSYPVENDEDLHNAAILARSGHGDVAAAKRLIAKRAKELGVANPLANDMSKDAEVSDKTEDKTPPAEAPEVTPAPVEKSVEVLVQEEVAKAVQPLQELNQKLEAEMALLKSTPIPGGPVVTVPGSQRNDAQRAQALAEAQRHERLAKEISGNPELTRYHEDKAAEYRQAAQA